MPIPNLDALIAQTQYEGMRVPDSAVFRKWLQHRGAFYDRVEFNVVVGRGSEPDPTWNDPLKELHRRQTAKRCDAVAWIGDQPVIIEGKGRPSVNALGQCLSYRRLYMLDHPDEPEPAMLVICDAIDPDVAVALQDHQISVEVYG
jgi:hypothetical protein